jgi:hypothetical protein
MQRDAHERSYRYDCTRIAPELRLVRLHRRPEIVPAPRAPSSPAKRRSTLTAPGRELGQPPALRAAPLQAPTQPAGARPQPASPP